MKWPYRRRTYDTIPRMRKFALILSLSLAAFAQDEPPAAPAAGRRGRGGANADTIIEFTFSSLRGRQVGPAFVSGRVSQIALFPDSSSHYLIAEASGGVWLTYNNGTTWTPVFDNYGS